MAPIFSKNAILVGSVDYFCLVCETHLKSDRDACVHLAKPVHLKQVELIQYVEDFKADGIKKIKNKYFCELCNKLLTVLARVRLHITEQSHIDNKNVNALKRVGNFIVAFEKVAINDLSWNGLYENSCIICNLEYDNEEIHKNLVSHILNMIQINVEFDNNQNIYRKIDENSLHCLTCNTVIGFNSEALISHFDEAEHKTQYHKCCESYHQIQSNEQVEKTVQGDNKSETINKEEKNTKPQTIRSYHANDIKISALKANDIKEPIVKVDDLNNVNIKQVTDNDVTFVYEEEDKICKTLKAVDYVTRDESNKLWCILCGQFIESESAVSSHVNGKHHQTLSKLHKKRLLKIKQNSISENHKKETSKIADDEILEKINVFQKDNIQVNFESRTAFCKKCKIHVEFVCEEIERHTSGHKNKANNNISENHKKVTNKIAEDDISKKLNDFQKDNIQVNFKSRTVFCKKCKINIEFLCEEIERHTSEHKNKAVPNNVCLKKEPKAKTTDFDTIPGHIKSKNVENNEANTPICNKNKIPSNIDSKSTTENVFSSKTAKSCAILDTVTSNNEKENIPKTANAKEIRSENFGAIEVSNPKLKKPKAINLVRVSSSTFIQTLTAMQHLTFKDFVINNKYCINACSFKFLVAVGPDRLRCLVCETAFDSELYNEHYLQHEDALAKSAFIVHDDSEFIREIRPGYFHCGFCNMVKMSWGEMDLHLRSSSHKEDKISASWRLEMYKPKMDTLDFERMSEEMGLDLNTLINLNF